MDGYALGNKHGLLRSIDSSIAVWDTADEARDAVKHYNGDDWVVVPAFLLPRGRSLTSMKGRNIA
tara:strand:+ start:2114 stop:2308 length:195 start_codon:yes stop_codon:yes gene_type:complete